MNARPIPILLACMVGAVMPAAAGAGQLSVGRTPGELSVSPTGTASYTIPIEVPPGTAGLAPELSITYASGAGDGIAGKSWSLTGLPAITRCPASRPIDGFSRGVHGHFEDRLCLDGERLVSTSGPYWGDGVQYRTLRESWSRVTAHLDSSSNFVGPGSLTVETREGLRLEMGGTDDARVMTSSGAVLRWAVNRITDVHGNTIEVSYERHGNTLYPRHVTYGGRHVEMVYENRPDRPRRFQAGLELRMSRRLARIDTYLAPRSDIPGHKPAPPQLVSRYRLDYQISHATGASLLHRVRRCDAAGTCLPPTTFTYDNPWFDGTFDISTPADGIFQNALRHDPGAVLTPGDFDGDGITDFIRRERGKWDDDTTGTAHIYLADGEGSFTRQPLSDHVMMKGDLTNLIVGDYNGDGLQDFIRQERGKWDDDDGNTAFLYTSRGDGTFHRGGLTDAKKMKGDVTRLIPGDFDGDGRTDFIRQEYGKYDDDDVATASVYLSRGGHFERVLFPHHQKLKGDFTRIIPGDFDGDGMTDFIRQEYGKYDDDNVGTASVWRSWGDGTFERIDFQGNHTLKGDLTNIIPGDFNGDGMTDFVRQERGSWDDDFVNSFQVFLSRGDGEFTIVTPGQNQQSDPFQDFCRFDPGVTLIPGDFNGDGLTDLIRQEKGGWDNDLGISFQILVSTGDGDFEFVTPGGEAYQHHLRQDPGAFIHVGDFDGDGQADFLRQEHGDWDHDQHLTFQVYHNRHQRPDLLGRIDEGSGLRTTLRYAPLTDPEVYTQGSGKGYPDNRFRGPLYVVASYEQEDRHRDDDARRFSYHYEDARLARDGRGFLGFRRTSRIEHHLDLETRYRFDESWPFSHMVTRTEVRRASDGTLLSAIALEYGLWQPEDASYFLAPVRQDTTSVESGGTLLTRKTFDYDAYGNVTRTVDLGAVGEASDDSASCTVYSNDPTAWRLGLPVESLIARTCTDACDCEGVASRQRQHFDARGRVIRIEEHEHEADRWIGQDFAYDEHGNIVEKISAAGTVTAYVFDDTYHSFPVAQTLDAAGARLITQYETAPAFGTVVREVTPSGDVMRRELDGFGKTVRMFGPGPGGETLLATSTMAGAPGNAYEELRTRIEWNSAAFTTTRTYRDAFDRTYRVETLDASGGEPLAVTTGYDSAGRLLRKSLPHRPGETPAFTEYRYDATGRPSRVELPGGGVQEVEYELMNGPCDGCVVRQTLIENRGASEERRMVLYLDSRGQVRRREHAGDMPLRYDYDLLGRVTRYQDAAAATTIEYDSLGRKQTVASTDTGETWFEYDDTGRLARIVDALDHEVVFTHDAMDRVVEKRFSDGRTLIFEHDDPLLAGSAGRVSSAYILEDGALHSRFDYAYDPFGKLASKAIVFEGQTYTFSMTYGPTGQPTSLTYPDGSTLTHDYDAHGRLAALRLDGVLHASYGDYTAMGQPGTIHYANGVDTTRAYAAHGALERSQVVTGSGDDALPLLDKEYQYDLRMQITGIVDHLAQTEQRLYYDTRGFLAEVHSPDYGTRSYAYDAAGNLTDKAGVTQIYEGHRVVADSLGTTYGYDAIGNRVTRSTADASWQYVYDHGKHLTEVHRDGALVGAYEYDPEGMRIKKTDASGVVTVYLTPQYEISRFPDGRALHTRYLFGPGGRVAAVSQQEAAAQARIAQHQAALAGITGRGRPIATAAPRTTIGTFVGTRLLALIGLLVLLLSAAALWRSARPGSAPGRLRATARLALTHWTGRAIVPGWDASGTSRRRRALAPMVPAVVCALLVSLSACKPGGSGDLGTVSVLDNGLTYQDLGATLEPGANGHGYPVAGTYFFHQDRVGTTSLVTDAAGEEVSRLVYLPYGEVHQPGSSGFDVFRAKFGDKELDRDAALYYFDARYYDPASGRFITADPYLVGGDPQVPGVLNRYQYAGNNPIVHADPSGNLIWFLAAVFAAALVGGYAAGVGANGGNFNPAKWEWNAQTIGSIAAGAAVGALSVIFPSAAITLGIVDGAAQAAITGGSASEILMGGALGGILGGAGKVVGELPSVVSGRLKALEKVRRSLPLDDVTRGARRHLDGDTLNLMPDSDGFLQAIRDREGVDGFFDVLGHGNRRVMASTPEGPALTPGQVASMIRRHPTWRGRNVRLTGCLTGLDDDGFARQLADELGVVVRAPRGITHGNRLGDRRIWVSLTPAEGGRVGVTGDAPFWRDFAPAGFL